MSSQSPLTFSIVKKLEAQKNAGSDAYGAQSLGRAGIITTSHGTIETPAFVTVGTKGTVKALTPEQILETGAQVVLANTYHLYLQPSDLLIKKMGGLNRAMNWHGPTMTDSGGFQVFSLGAAYGKGIGKVANGESDDANSNRDGRSKKNHELPEAPEELAPKIVHIDEMGVTFTSHIDGSKHYFTPSRSIEIQHNIGADIIFAFDECTSPQEPFTYQRQALDRTHRWAQESLRYHHSKPNAHFQALFGIVQGGRFEALRKESAETVANMTVDVVDSDGAVTQKGFDGFGIGGSFAKEDMQTAVGWVNSILPEYKTRHLLGIGEPLDLFMAVEQGCDLFDCVAPTRIARTGQAYTNRGKINLKNAEFVEDLTPIDAECHCSTCRNYTRAYLSHLFRSKEMLAATLTSIHNLYFIIHLTKKMRRALLDGTFYQFRDQFIATYRD